MGEKVISRQEHNDPGYTYINSGGINTSEETYSLPYPEFVNQSNTDPFTPFEDKHEELLTKFLDDHQSDGLKKGFTMRFSGKMSKYFEGNEWYTCGNNDFTCVSTTFYKDDDTAYILASNGSGHRVVEVHSEGNISCENQSIVLGSGDERYRKIIPYLKEWEKEMKGSDTEKMGKIWTNLRKGYPKFGDGRYNFPPQLYLAWRGFRVRESIYA